MKPDSNGVAEVGLPKPVSYTVREMLDKRIADARKRLEDACIAKARAEAQQLLEFQVQELGEIIFG